MEQQSDISTLEDENTRLRHTVGMESTGSGNGQGLCLLGAV